MEKRSELLPAIGLVGALTLAALAIARPMGPSAPAPQPGPMTVSGGDYQGLSTLVSRLFRAQVAEGSRQGRHQLRVGAMPPGMPFEVPNPPGTTLVGSLANDLPDDAQIALDSNASLDELVSTYRESFLAQGFADQTLSGGPAILPDGQPSGYSGSFCRARDSVSIFLGITPQTGKPTSIMIYGNWHGQSVTCLDQNGEGVIGLGRSLIPKILTPVGSVVRETGGGGSTEDGTAETEAEIEYPTTAQKLAEYVMPQLADAGWTLTGSTASEYGAWSTWSLKDAEGHAWRGALVIITSPISNRFSLRVEVERQP